MKMNSENLDELVFENRNKEYGAYVIRKEYARSLKMGMFVTFASVGLLVLCSFVTKKGDAIIDPPEIPIVDSGIVIVIPPPPAPPIPPVPPVEPAGGPRTTLSIPVVVDKPTDTAQTMIPQNVEPVPTDPGPSTASTGSSTGGEEGPPTVASTYVEPPTYAPDEQPEMEGGVMKFLRKNLTYPDIAVEKRTKGTVHISFIVEKDGSVSNINVLRGIGDGCEEEAVRVVKKMKWKPGKNHGIPVRVPFTLPVKFTINE